MIIYMKSAHGAVLQKQAQWQVHEGQGVSGQEFLAPLLQCFLLRSCISKYISTFGRGGCWMPRGICACTCSCKYISTLATAASSMPLANQAPCAQNDKINVLHEPYFGTHILGNHLPFQTSEIPKKNTKPLISIRGLAFDKLLQSSEK